MYPVILLGSGKQTSIEETAKVAVELNISYY